MKPEDVNRKIFETVPWVPEKNGCFPLSLAGVFAFNYPQMSQKETLAYVKELLRPIQQGEALYSQQGRNKFRKPYDFISGEGYWTHLVHFGYGEALREDTNNRLKRLGLDLQMDFLSREESPIALRLLQHGATLIPTFSVYTDGKFNEFHSICLGTMENRVYAVDVNHDLREKTWESVQAFLTDLNYREPYYGPPGTQIGGTNVPTILFEKVNTQ